MEKAAPEVMPLAQGHLLEEARAKARVNVSEEDEERRDREARSRVLPQVRKSVQETTEKSTWKAVEEDIRMRFDEDMVGMILERIEKGRSAIQRKKADKKEAERQEHIL